MSNTESFFVAGWHPDLRCHGACELPRQDWLTYKAQVYFVKADHNSMGFLEPCANILSFRAASIWDLGGFGWINYLWIWSILVNIPMFHHVSSCLLMVQELHIPFGWKKHTLMHKTLIFAALVRIWNSVWPPFYPTIAMNMHEHPHIYII